MNTQMKWALVVTIVLILVGAAVYYFLPTGTLPLNVVPGARTVYTGSVEIEPQSLADIKTALIAQGCKFKDDTSTGTVLCNESSTSQNGKTNFTVSYGKAYLTVSLGLCMGPCGFTITENSIEAVKDIDGPPSPEKYKTAVREDLRKIGNIVKLNESAWHISKMEYPVTYVY